MIGVMRMNKCSGCFYKGEYQDMGGSTPVCLRQMHLLDAIKAYKSEGPCIFHTTFGEVGEFVTQKVAKMKNLKKSFSDAILSVSEQSRDLIRRLSEAATEFGAMGESFIKNPCADCIHDKVCGNRSHEDERCDDFTEICYCSECAYNYALRNGLEFDKEDIICSYLHSDGLTEKDFCSAGMKLNSLTQEELFEIMDYDEIKKFKEKENAKDGLSAKVTIIDELHSINDKESKDEV